MPLPSIPPLRTLRRRLLSLSQDEASYAVRGFRGMGEPAQARLERIGHTFLSGYHIALEETGPQALIASLQHVEQEIRGFAFEGAAMALALLDGLFPWGQSRFQAFLNEGAASHAYMVHVGAGWAWRRLRQSVPRMLLRMDPLLGWLAVDGYGFHEGYFHWPRYVDRQEPPPLRHYAARVFDQGLGRSLWFVEGGGMERLIGRLRSFPASRQPDLWSGAGLACTYAGAVEREELVRLREAAGPLLPHVAQGAVFAARARQRAGNLASHSEWACEVLCECSASQAAALAESTLAALSTEDDTAPLFERWRQRIQQEFSHP
jgi:enediyne biosynthesis protein E3